MVTGDRLLDDAGAVSEPLVVVGPDDRPSRVRAARAAGRLVVGHGCPPPALRAAVDLVLEPAPGRVDDRRGVVVDDPAAVADRLRAAAQAAPHAATVLVQVVRAGVGLDAPAALDVESFAYSMLLSGPEFASWLARRGPPRHVPQDPSDPVLVARTRDALHVTLHRPRRRNAYGREMRDALVAALELAEAAPELGTVVLGGAGPVFCSGGDLDEFGTAPDPVTAHLVRTRGGAGVVLHRLRARVTARLHGSCVGAGVELPAFADRVEADPATTFRLPELGMGLIPGAGGTVSLPQRIGIARFLYLALSGRPIEATTAHAWGLVDELRTVTTDAAPP